MPIAGSPRRGLPALPAGNRVSDVLGDQRGRHVGRLGGIGRIAIGADQSDVVRMVLRQGLILSLAGIAVGGVISLAAGRALAAGFAGLGTPNLATFIVVPAAVLAVTMIACWSPARRAARVDPIRALRFE